MKVKEIMAENPITIERKTLISDAFDLMKENDIRRLPVTENGELIDIVTKKDLNEMSASPASTLSVFELNYLLAKTTIGDILKIRKDRPDFLVTIDQDALVGQAAVLMREYKIGGVPVTKDGDLVGVITETDIFDAFVKVMGFKEQGTRIMIEMESDKKGVIAEISELISQKQGNITQFLTYLNKEGKYIIEMRFEIDDGEKMVEEIKANGFNVIHVVY